MSSSKRPNELLKFIIIILFLIAVTLVGMFAPESVSRSSALHTKNHSLLLATVVHRQIIDHSYLSAIIGSTFVARRAGM
jgi:hypothetical protein